MATSYPQFVLLGDSLIKNSVDIQNGFSFQAALQSLCIRRMDVINRGLSGYTTRSILRYIDDIFPEPTTASPKIKYLAILIGANDAVLPWSPSKHHVPIEQYKENLTRIVNHPRVRADNPKILLVTPPPVDELHHRKIDDGCGQFATIRTHAVSASYAEKTREVARENPGGIVLIDLWQAIMDKAISMAPDDYQPGGPWLGCPENGKAGGLTTLLPDGVHMNGDAYRVFFDTIRPHVGKEWEDLPDEEGWVYPGWEVVNEVHGQAA